MKQKFSKIFFLSAVFFLLPKFVFANVIFETNFDSNADWNTSGQYEGNECADPCTTAPTNWTNYRVVDGSGTWPNPVGSIQRLPGLLADHTGTDNGKAFVVYNESHSNDNWPGDAILMNHFGAQYKELYLRAWIRTQAGWQATGSALSKILRLQYYDESKNGPGYNFANFDAGSNAPTALLELGTMGDTAQHPDASAYAMAHRCLPAATLNGLDQYYCEATGPLFQQTDTSSYINTSTFPSITGTGSWADAQWHELEMHVVMNDPGASNGTYELFFDGNKVDGSHTGTVQWVSPGYSVPGWNVVAIGGNSDNSFAGTSNQQGSQWYAIDDVVVSTTPIIDGASDLVAPAAPSGLSVQ